MRGDDAYAVLGLRPGAGRAEIDQAYRRLIKRYHPDYANGDANRAAELNRAYSELRALTRDVPRAPPPSAAMQRQLYSRRGSRWGTGVMLGAAAVAAAAVVALSASTLETSPAWPRFSSADVVPGIAESRAVRPSRQSANLDEPLATELIDSSVGDAMRLHADRDPVAAAKFSRDCLSRMSANPSAALFDSCAAYDEAITVLAVGNSAFESGVFSPSAVTARQVGAARLLSADYFEAESRLQQIRSRVHMVLLPKILDGGVARERLVARTEAPAPIAETPVTVPAFEARAEPRRTIRRSRSTSPPPQLPRETAMQRPPAPARRVAAPPVQRRAAAEPAPSADSGKAPAWQQPMRPAWQRPLSPSGQ